MPGETGFSCNHILKGTFNPSSHRTAALPHRFTLNVDRYYVDETVALPLEKLFRDKGQEFSVGLSLRPDGTAALEKLYVSGMPLEDYIRDHKQELTSE